MDPTETTYSSAPTHGWTGRAIPFALEGLLKVPAVGVALNVLRRAIPYALFLVIYGANGNLHLLPKYSDIQDITLYNISAFEEFVFRCQFHKLVSSVSHTVTDILAAIPYLMHYGIPVVYPAYLLLRGKSRFACQFYWLLGWVCWAHFVIWFVWPTAPPWLFSNLEMYHRFNTTISLNTTVPFNSTFSPNHLDGLGPTRHLLDEVATVDEWEMKTIPLNAIIPPLGDLHKEGCAFGRLDTLTGIPFFYNMFDGNPAPFGSMPSGHVAWATAIYVTRPPGGNVFVLYVLWVAWATLYSCHHYLSDAIAAFCLVLTVKGAISFISRRKQTPAPEDPEGDCGLQGVEDVV